MHSLPSLAKVLYISPYHWLHWTGRSLQPGIFAMTLV